MNPPSSGLYERLRLHGALRGAIIGYGIGAYALFFPTPAAPSLLVGIGLQVLVLAVRKFLASRDPAEGPPAATMFFFELVVDAITVLLFALATFRGIGQSLNDL